MDISRDQNGETSEEVHRREDNVAEEFCDVDEVTDSTKLDPEYMKLFPEKGDINLFSRREGVEHWIVRFPSSLEHEQVMKAIIESQKGTKKEQLPSKYKCLKKKFRAKSNLSRVPLEYKFVDLETRPAIDEVSGIHLVVPDDDRKKYVVNKVPISAYISAEINLTH